MDVRSVAFPSELPLTKVKVYVSATFADLAECRDAVHLATRRLGMDDVAMESYVAHSQQQLE